MSVVEAVQEKFGEKVGLTVRDGVIIEWPYPLPQPTQQEIETLVGVYRQRVAYKALRTRAYPSVPEQLDDLYHLGYEGWKAKIKAVKDRYPKV